MAKGNELLKKLAVDNSQISYIDIATPFLKEDSKPRADVFLGDNLHLNKKCYAIWTKIIRAKLVK